MRLANADTISQPPAACRVRGTPCPGGVESLRDECPAVQIPLLPLGRAINKSPLHQTCLVRKAERHTASALPRTLARHRRFRKGTAGAFPSSRPPCLRPFEVSDTIDNLPPESVVMLAASRLKSRCRGA